MAAILPEIGASFEVTASTAASTLTSYLVPFALLMLVSGTLGERWGAARTIRIAYVGYALAALASALAPSFWLFQVTRGLQGCANAFTTPLLMAKLATVTPNDRLGRALGVFGAMQAVGQTSAPLVGGLAAELSWRWAFVGIALVAAVLAAWPLPADTPAEGTPARLRDPWRREVLLPGVVALVAWACLAGVSYLVAFRLEDAFGLSAGLRGLVLTGYGAAGFVTARLVGAASDRYGPRLAGVVGLLLGAGLLMTIGVSGALPVAAISWAVGGVCGQLVIVAVNATVLGGEERGRGGAISLVQAMRFLGMAAAPALFTAPYHASPVLGFGIPAALLLLVLPFTAGLTRRPSRG